MSDADPRRRAGAQLAAPITGSCFALIAATLFLGLASEWNEPGSTNSVFGADSADLATRVAIAIAVAGLIANIAVAVGYRLTGWKLVGVFVAYLVALPLAVLTAISLLDFMYPPYVSPV